MQLRSDRWTSKRGWQAVLIVLAIFSLTFNLATRFCVRANAQIHVVKSVDRRGGEPKRQHLNKDASRWIAPNVQFSRLEPTIVDGHLAPVEPVLANHLSDKSLYNRPPPFFL